MSDEEIKDEEAVEEVLEEVVDDTEEEADVEGTELEGFEAAEIEEQEELSTDEIASIVESVLFATEKPQSAAVIKQAFRGTTVKVKDIRKAIDSLQSDYIETRRGFTIEEVNGGYQLRTKVDNMTYLKRMIKARSFKVSGPALEVLSIVAYKQPVIKHEIDEIRGVESGHLLRGLMDRSLVMFAGKSELPGRPMLYSTTKKFLEIFGLRNIKELPSLAEIDELIPEGIGEVEEKEETLDMITDAMSKDAGTTYSEGEAELETITETLSEIDTSSEFFEQEKQRMKDKRDAEKAQNIRDALLLEEDVSTRDKNWLTRYEEAQAARAEAETAPTEEASTEEVTEESAGEEMVAQAEEVQASSEEELPIEGEPDIRDSLEALTQDAQLEANSESVDEEIAQEAQGEEEPPAPILDVEKLKEDLSVFDEVDSPSKLDN